MKKTIVPTVILSITLAFIFAMSGCALILEEDKRQVLNAYTSEDSLFKYYTFKAKVRSVNDYGGHKCFELDVDYDYFEQAYGDDDYTYLDGEKRWEGAYSLFDKYEHEIVPSNTERLLIENGGYDLLQEGTEAIITVNSFYGWRGWRYPILSLEIDGTVYLDYETGLENYLNYVKAGFKDP